jgi:hypothetical protein
MDAWTGLWFWPFTDTKGATPPTLDQWIEACQALLGREPEARKNNHGQKALGDASNWDELNAAEELNLGFALARGVDEVRENHPWLRTCEDVAQQQGFFHWELDFATVFARGGFDLQLGNPPWVRPRTDVDALMAEGDPWWQLAVKPSEAARTAKRHKTFELPGIRDLVISATADVVVTAEYLSSAQAYPMLAGLQPDLYRCFMEQTWNHASLEGVTALIHPETHFTDEKAGLLRENTYLRLRRHWQFVNELQLYEIRDQQLYGVHVYGCAMENVKFIMASSLYHPDTVERSLKHDGSGDEPGLKDPSGNWDLRPHHARIIFATDVTLRTWHGIMEGNSVPLRRTRMVYAVNTTIADILAGIAPHQRIDSLGLRFSRGWNESTDRQKGYFQLQWGIPRSWHDVIPQGPHLYVSTPMYKSVNPTMKNKADWSATDFEALPAEAIPITAYKPAGNRHVYDADYDHWNSASARTYYRIAWRRMAANVGERTLIPALIPPGAAHVHPVSSAGLPEGSAKHLCAACGILSSLIADLCIRAAPKNDIHLGTINRLPLILDQPLQTALVLRVLRLNCVTGAYADLWRDAYMETYTTDRWAGGRPRANRPALGEVTAGWTKTSVLRIAEDRRQAQIEIDALVALMFGVTADQLCTIYRAQFSVLYGYDHWNYVYDAKGRLVPNEVLSVWRKKGDNIGGVERTATNQAGHTYIYELPFRIFDREADMRTAYTEFERRLAAHE